MRCATFSIPDRASKLASERPPLRGIYLPVTLAQNIEFPANFAANGDVCAVPTSIRKTENAELFPRLVRMIKSMELQYEIERLQDVAVARCAGRMVRGAALDGFRRRIEQLDRLRVLVLDLSEIQQLDAGGLGTLLLVRRWALQNSARLKLVDPPPFFRRMLEATHLSSVFEISSLKDAIFILRPECPPRFAVA
jgi:anti-anti-sigma factor